MNALATVRTGEIGATMRLNATARWTSGLAGHNQSTGIVTSVQHESGLEAQGGDELYSVDLRPVVIAQGLVPAFRDLARDMEGADVEQLQALLADLGHYGGTVDGIARAATDAAIRSWQKASGMPVTGTVALGDIVFVPALPARISLDRNVIERGRALLGGEPVVQALAPAPVLTISATVRQSAMVPVDAAVSLAGPGGEHWEARVGDRRRDPDTDHLNIQLVGVDARVLCGNECDAIPVVGDTSLDAVITTTATVVGLIIPAATLISDADGTRAVIDEHGSRRAVTVVASANGMAVVEGLTEGTRVRLPSSEDAAP